MAKHFWRNQDEQKVIAYKSEHPDCIVAMAYEAWLDADCYIIFKDMQEYDEYRSTHFTSMYSGWITLDFDFKGKDW